MLQFLDSIKSLLNSENPELISIILIPACFIESALLYNIVVTFLRVNLEKKKNIFYTIFFSIISVVLSLLIPAPFNTIISYILVVFLLKIILHVNLLKCFVSLLLSLFIIALIIDFKSTQLKKVFSPGMSTITILPVFSSVMTLSIMSRASSILIM